MKEVIFDFEKYHSKADFYQDFSTQFKLPEYFGDNLDSLWDVISAGEIELPVIIKLINLSKDKRTKKSKFQQKLVKMFKDARRLFENQFVIILETKQKKTQ